jgi:hypothetical protein
MPRRTSVGRIGENTPTVATMEVARRAERLAIVRILEVFMVISFVDP